MNFMALYRAAEVRRFHTMRVLHSHSVGEHSWGVAFIIQWLYYPGLPSAQLLCSALNHDLPEALTGDVPVLAKWHTPALEEVLVSMEERFRSEHEMPNYPLLDIERRVLSFADMADLVCYALAECEMGNQRMGVVVERGLTVLEQRQISISSPPKMDERINAMIALLKDAYRGFLEGRTNGN